METASTFLKLSPSESILDEWEVLDAPRRIMFGDVVLILIGLFLVVLPGFPIYYICRFFEFLPPEWLHYAVRAFGLLVAVCVAFTAFTRHHRTGHLCLTNWRLLYYERGQAYSRSYHYVHTTDLEDVVGVQTLYERRLLGETRVILHIHTKHDDMLNVHIGETGGILTKIPLLRLLFWRRSIGKDTHHVPPQLYRLVKERQGQLAETSSKF